jgi:hypothetical protein
MSVYVRILGICLLAAWVSFGTFFASDHFLRDRGEKLFVFDADRSLKLFTEALPNNISDEEFLTAVRLLEEHITEESQRLYAAEGALIVNVDHVLAGGTDITDWMVQGAISRFRSDGG